MFNPRSPYAQPNVSMGGGAQRAPMAARAPAQSMYAPRVQNQPIAPRQAPRQAPAKKEGGGMGDMMGMASGMMGGGGGGAMAGLSDKHSKEQIQKLEGANEALTQALSSSASFPDEGAPQENLGPMQANFADTPAANKVAAQNVAMQPQQGPPGEVPNPSQSNMAMSGSPAFKGVGGGAPDLSALDEAYKRMGRGG